MSPGPGGFARFSGLIWTALHLLLILLNVDAASKIALVRGTFTAARIPSEAQGVNAYYAGIREGLKASRIRFDELTDEEVVAGKLLKYRLAILPYNSVVPKVEEFQLTRFLDQGGKLIAFYTLPASVRDRFHLEFVRRLASDPPGQFAQMRFRTGLITGLPEVVEQSSWNVQVARIKNPATQLLAQWHDSAGKSTGRAAWVLSPQGAWMSHVLLPASSPEDQQQLLLALVGHFLPEVWERPALSALSHSARIGGMSRMEELEPLLESQSLSSSTKRKCLKAIKAALAARDQAYQLAIDRQFAEARMAALAARQHVEEAYYRMQLSRKNEFRGVWVHSPYGIKGWNWDRTAQSLKDNGFNALMANLLWSGRAYYPSQILPHSNSDNDLLAKCVEACHRHDIELHVWKVTWNLSTAPQEFLNRMRSEGRTQRARTGAEVDWLCPSHPLNFVMERDSLLEVVRNYPVDGLHFDYIRYPNSRTCYCLGCQARFEERIGVTVDRFPEDVISGPQAEAFKQWRRDQISRLVFDVSRKARKIRSTIKISAAVYGAYDDCRHTVGQDWKLWVDAGWLDFVCPMNYETDDKVFASLVKRQVQWVDGQAPLYIGIGAYRLESPEQLIPQIEMTRKLGADGFILFEHDRRLATKFLPALRWGATAIDP